MINKNQPVQAVQKQIFVSLKDEKGILPFSMKKGSMAETMNGLDNSEKNLEFFIRLLEKAMHEVLWYIGADMLGDSYYERFMFNKSGFLEILLGEKTEIKAYFPTSEKAEKFKKALQHALTKLLKEKASAIIKDIK